MNPYILVVDDDAEVRKLYSLMLTDEGAFVVEASNGASGLQSVSDRRPDLIITDLGMPVMDGFDFLRFRNEDPQLAAVPVVLVTNAKPHERPTTGVNDVVRKPIDIDEILFAIKRYCA